jgi:hypothetical protein
MTDIPPGNKSDPAMATYHDDVATIPIDTDVSEKQILYYSDPHVHGFLTTTNELPRSYYRISYFLGSFFAVEMALLSANGGFGLIAPVLDQINADIGPSDNIIWVPLVYRLTLAIGLLLVGRLTDTFGRRWFFIVDGLFGVVGSIVCATANSINVLIGGTLVVGLGACIGI